MMPAQSMKLLLVFISTALYAATPVPFDFTPSGNHAIRVEAAPDAVHVAWQDKSGQPWTAQFSLDPAQPLITSIALRGKTVIDRAQPIYRASTGKRRGGF